MEPDLNDRDLEKINLKTNVNDVKSKSKSKKGANLFLNYLKERVGKKKEEEEVEKLSDEIKKLEKLETDAQKDYKSIHKEYKLFEAELSEADLEQSDELEESKETWKQVLTNKSQKLLDVQKELEKKKKSFLAKSEKVNAVHDSFNKLFSTPLDGITTDELIQLHNSIELKNFVGELAKKKELEELNLDELKKKLDENDSKVLDKLLKHNTYVHSEALVYTQVPLYHDHPVVHTISNDKYPAINDNGNVEKNYQNSHAKFTTVNIIEFFLFIFFMIYSFAVMISVFQHIYHFIVKKQKTFLIKSKLQNTRNSKFC